MYRDRPGLASGPIWQRVERLEVMRQQDQHPNRDRQEQRGKHGGGADVFGAPREFVPLETNPVNNDFDSGVEQFNNQHQQQTTYQQGFFHARLPQPKAQWRGNKAKHGFQPERLFVQPSGFEAFHGIEKSRIESGQAL